MKKLLLLLMTLVLSIPIWASEHTVTINRGEGLYQDGTGVYYCVKDGIMMTFSDGLDNENYLVERRAKTFEVRSYNYIIKKIVFHCVDNVLEGDPNFYWGPTTISLVSNFTYPGQLGTYYVTNNGYDGVWEGQTSAFMFTTSDGKPVRFGSVDIIYDKLEGDIFDLVTSTSQIQEGKTYILVNRDDERVMRLKLTDDSTFPSTPILGWMGPDATPYTKVKVDGNAILFRMDQLKDTTIGTATYYKTAWFNTLNGYIRTRSNSSGDATTGMEVRTSINSYCRAYFYVAGSATLNNFLAKFNGNTNYTVRYNPSSKQFMGYKSTSDPSTRVWLYKLAEPYHVYTECTPANSGNITLESGVVEGTSQEYETVTFSVSPTGAYGVGEVTVTNLTTNEVTVLQPTSTGPTGNEYSFEMPAADVTITANFVPAYEIHTVSNPTGGGSFNFTDGYIENNGQPMSTNGQTVTFEVTPADGYSLSSVTVTDDVTSQTTTLTPDGNGVYSFVMPGNNVTLTANFEEAHDLYLLGTANGETVWHPYGPKFTFDGENQVYYIDVYFKGDSLYNNGAGDSYGHFSLSRMISTNPNEGAGWGEISGYRIFATSPDYWVQDGGTYNNCFQTYTDQAFKIPAGVYRITVSKDLDQMTISEYKPTLVFTPAGGTLNDPTLVDLNTEVVITSNLEQLVHDINPNEPSHATFYNTTDGWATNEHDNTRVISDYDVTTITANVNLGYIKKEGNASYEVISDLYLLGTANGMNSWQPYGPQFTYDANTETYSLDVYFTGLNVTAADEGYGYFSLSKVISNPQQPNWGDIPNSARINAQYNDFPITGLAYNQSTDADLYQTDPNWCFKIDPGIYTITVNKDKTEMTVTKHELTLTFNPVSGTTVAAGDQVNISSNLEQLVYAINQNETLHQTIMYATSTDGTLQTPDTQGSTVTITAVDATTTVNAEAKLGYITVTGNANYIVPAPTVYNITTIVTPEGAGTITAPAGATAGTTVTFTVGTNEGYRLDQVQVTYGSNLAILDHTYNPETGEYTFVMPNDDVRIYADYAGSYDITTVVTPDGAGVITVPDDAFAGETVTFTVTTNTGYMFDGVTVTYTDGSTGTIAVTDNGNGSYSFTMPDKEVTIQAEFTRVYNVVTSCDPAEGGAITLNGVNTPQTISVAPGTEVVFSVEANTGYEFIGVVLANETMQWEEQPTSLGNSQYSFVMPDHDVLITAMFAQDLYLLGTANGQTGWHTYGPKFTYDRDNEEYYVDVYFKGGNDDPNEEQDKGFFNVTTRIDMNDNWENVNPYRLGSASNPLTIYDEDIQNGVRKRLLPDYPENVFRIKPGVFRIHVTKDKSYLYVSEYPLTVTFDPVSGSIVAQGTVASAASNLEALVHAINPNEDPAYLEVSEDNTYHWHEGNTMAITQVGRTRFHFRASIGYIVAQGVAEYFLDEPEDGFNITTVILPEEYSSGGYIVVAPSSHTAHTGHLVGFNVGTYEGYQIESVEVVTDPDEEIVEIQPDGILRYTFVMPHSDVIIILVLSEMGEPIVEPTTLKDIEDPDNPIKQGDDVIVADELIGVWKVRQYLWAKDQAQSNYFLPKGENTIDFVRDRMKREGIDWQPRDWDQSNWVILDFGEIEEFLGWEEDPAIYQAMQNEMDRFVDNTIMPGTITGTYNCKGLSTSDWHYNGDPYATKRNHIIALSEAPDCDTEPTGLIENSLGYPGYDEDPLETKHYPGHPERYMYNHYMPYNFLTANTVSEGISASQASISHYNLNPNDRYFFMAPKDQEVAHVWAVWVGQKEFEDPIGPVTPGNDPEMMERDVFATYQYSPADDVNKYGFSGAFYVESWYYNRLYDENGAELYGKPGVDNDPSYALQVDKAYMFHIAIQYPARVASVPQAPARAPEASNDNPGAYKVYPLDMMGSDQTVTAVRELLSRDAVTIKSMTYYNMMGQASDKPFDGINVIVVRYTDGTSRSWKVLR